MITNNRFVLVGCTIDTGCNCLRPVSNGSTPPQISKEGRRQGEAGQRVASTQCVLSNLTLFQRALMAWLCLACAAPHSQPTQAEWADGPATLPTGCTMTQPLRGKALMTVHRSSGSSIQETGRRATRGLTWPFTDSPGTVTALLSGHSWLLFVTKVINVGAFQGHSPKWDSQLIHHMSTQRLGTVLLSSCGTKNQTLDNRLSANSWGGNKCDSGGRRPPVPQRPIDNLRKSSVYTYHSCRNKESKLQ